MPALPGDAVPAAQWGVSGGRLLRMPTCTLWETPVCPRAVILPPDRAEYSRVKQRIIVAYLEQEIGVESFYGIRVSRRRAPWLTRATSIP